ncbi:MAG: peptidylprolyl isomerase [Chitinophagaceae bacterium]|nr:peptidylprolyl isomerase [Chitinophagaceae bacterium]
MQYDLQSFRTQVEDSYMNDEKSVNTMVDEAFDRSQKDVHVYHFFVPITAETIPADTVKAYNALKEVAKELKGGKTDFDKIARDVSANIYKIKNGDIGFITAFTLPYEYENIIYKLAVGESSGTYRSKKGIHIFKNIEERKSVGKWRIAQILFAFAPGENAGNSPLLKQKADSVYNLIKNGANFGEMAKSVSDDKMTYTAGGELPEFTTGKFQPQFEKEVFKLKNNDEVSSVFATAFGYHIVKRLEQIPTPNSKEDANYLFELKQKVQQDARINIAKEKFAQDILNKLGYKKKQCYKRN